MTATTTAAVGPEDMHQAAAWVKGKQPTNAQPWAMSILAPAGQEKSELHALLVRNPAICSATTAACASPSSHLLLLAAVRPVARPFVLHIAVDVHQLSLQRSRAHLL